MGIEIFMIGEGDKAARVLVAAAGAWTSAIRVQGQQRLNVGIVVGSQISDLISDIWTAGNYYSATVSGMDDVFSGTITLQRRMGEESLDTDWREVSNWAIDSAASGEGGSESTTAIDDPETVEYRIGCSLGADYTDGVAMLRIGTS